MGLKFNEKKIREIVKGYAACDRTENDRRKIKRLRKKNNQRERRADVAGII